MTLKEKFARLIHIPLGIEGFYIDMDKVEEAEQIADDYAIEFAEWFDEIRVERELLYDTRSIKQLLEIFKKEKGL